MKDKKYKVQHQKIFKRDQKEKTLKKYSQRRKREERTVAVVVAVVVAAAAVVVGVRQSASYKVKVSGCHARRTWALSSTFVAASTQRK